MFQKVVWISWMRCVSPCPSPIAFYKQCWNELYSIYNIRIMKKPSKVHTQPVISRNYISLNDIIFHYLNIGVFSMNRDFNCSLLKCHLLCTVRNRASPECYNYFTGYTLILLSLLTYILLTLSKNDLTWIVCLSTRKSDNWHWSWYERWGCQTDAQVMVNYLLYPQSEIYSNVIGRTRLFLNFT